MSRIRGKNTAPELALRRAVWALGLRYRLQKRVDRFRPDLIFPREQLAIFVDGCFWHCCPLHSVKPKNNRTFWEKKLEGNVQRDAETNLTLAAKGWTVMRFWEHQIDDDVQRCAKIIADTINEIRIKNLRG